MIAGRATTDIALTGITAKVLSGDGTYARAPKDRTRDWKSLVLPRSLTRESMSSRSGVIEPGHRAELGTRA